MPVPKNHDIPYPVLNLRDLTRSTTSRSLS
jgi:hypothetical protein